MMLLTALKFSTEEPIPDISICKTSSPGNYSHCHKVLILYSDIIINIITWDGKKDGNYVEVMTDFLCYVQFVGAI